MNQAVRLIVLMGLVLGVVVAAVPQLVSASSRDVLLEDLHSPVLGEIQDDIHHRAERPGKVVRVIPWFESDGGYRVLVITEAGWVYQSGDDPSEWVLVGQILEGKGPR